MPSRVDFCAATRARSPFALAGREGAWGLLGWWDLYSALGEVSRHGLATGAPVAVESYGLSFEGEDGLGEVDAVLDLRFVGSEEADTGNAGSGDLDVGVSLAG